MKRKIVLWGTNEKEEKILVALHLLDKEGKVNLYTFNENIATEEFYNSLLNQWREGVEIEFPEGHILMERPLSITEGILPDEIKVDRPDLITRAQTEWHFVVLSSKLYEMYRSELEDLAESVEGLKEFDNKIWNEMRAFWSKVQEQVIEKNLFRDHASTLKTKTNRLFDQLKALKKKVDEEYEANSAKHKETFMNDLKDIEEKIEKGLGLKPIFEELKSLQNKLRNIKFTKKDRNKIWNKLDATFKVVKEKRFGDKGLNQTSNVGRHQRRYDGLVNAISKMEKSISRDKEDQKFQDRKIATTHGQLEMQIRQAKIKMIDERVKSKEIKLEDMYKTRTELEAKIAKDKQKEERQAKMREAKAAAEAKIAEEMKKTSEANKADAVKLEEAAAKIKEGKTKPKKDKAIPPVELPDTEAMALEDEADTAMEGDALKTESKEQKEEPLAKSEEAKAEEVKQEETLLGAITETMGEALEDAGDAMEDIVDTVKAVALVVEDKIEDAVEKFKEDTAKTKAKEELQDQKEEETVKEEKPKKEEAKDEPKGQKKEGAAKKEEPKKEDPIENKEKIKEEAKEEETLLGAITATIGGALEDAGEALEDVMDTVKSVAEVVEDKIEDAVENFKGEEEE